MDIDGIETKVLLQHYWILGGDLLLDLQHEGPPRVCFICPNLDEFLKLEGKDYNEKLILKIREVLVAKKFVQDFCIILQNPWTNFLANLTIGRLIKRKIDKRASVPWLSPSLGTRSLMNVSIKVRNCGGFPGHFDLGASCTVVLKSVSEVLMGGRVYQEYTEMQ